RWRRPENDRIVSMIESLHFHDRLRPHRAGVISRPFSERSFIHLFAGEEMDEGPFGEWTGYYASSMRPEPIMKVKRLYHRNNPIILGAPPTQIGRASCRERV